MRQVQRIALRVALVAVPLAIFLAPEPDARRATPGPGAPLPALLLGDAAHAQSQRICFEWDCACFDEPYRSQCYAKERVEDEETKRRAALTPEQRAAEDAENERRRSAEQAERKRQAEIKAAEERRKAAAAEAARKAEAERLAAEQKRKVDAIAGQLGPGKRAAAERLSQMNDQLAGLRPKPRPPTARSCTRDAYTYEWSTGGLADLPMAQAEYAGLAKKACQGRGGAVGPLQCGKVIAIAGTKSASCKATISCSSYTQADCGSKVSGE